jgi:hypothetical protein
MRNRFSRVLGLAREPQGFGTVERDGVPCLARTVPVCALESGFFGGFCLGIFGCGWREGGLGIGCLEGRNVGGGLTLGGCLALCCLCGGHYLVVVCERIQVRDIV